MGLGGQKEIMIFFTNINWKKNIFSDNGHKQK